MAEATITNAKTSALNGATMWVGRADTVAVGTTVTTPLTTITGVSVKYAAQGGWPSNTEIVVEVSGGQLTLTGASLAAHIMVIGH